MKRVMIIGGSGSGKSTLARQLGEITKLPIIHIDKMYWKPHWELRDGAELRKMILDTIQNDEWIFEGNNFPSFQDRINRADMLIFIDMPRWLRLFRVIKRMITGYGKSRPDMAEDCPERFDLKYLKFLKFVYEYDYCGKLRALELLNSVPKDVKGIHLKSRNEVSEFLKSV